MKTIELNDEELAVINEIRAEKARQEAAAKKLREEQILNKSLESKFREALTVARKEIEGHIGNARRCLNEAVAVSEKYGVPFSTDIVEMDTERQYIPTTYNTQWPGNNYKILSEFHIYINYDRPGWEYWNTSSMSC